MKGSWREYIFGLLDVNDISIDTENNNLVITSNQPTDRPTDRQTDKVTCDVALSRLNSMGMGESGSSGKSAGVRGRAVERVVERWKSMGESGRKWEKGGQSGREWERVGESGREWERVKESERE